MQYTRNYDFSAGTTIIADYIDEEFNDVAAVINGNIGTDNITNGSITTGKIVASVNPETRDAEIHQSFVYTGLTLNPTTGWSNLEAGITAGTAYVNGKRAVVSAVNSHTFTASKDTYVDVDYNGSITYVPVANGAETPAVTSNSTRLMKVVTSGTAITSYTDMRTLSPLKDRVCAFAAYDNRVGAQTAANTIVPLNTKRYDLGGDYNTSTYKFTAPVKGIYQFNWNAFTTSASGSRSGYYVNGTCMRSVSNGGGDTGGCINFSFTEYLQAGDTVWMQPQSGYTMYWYGGDGMHNQFSGHLVREI